MPVTESFTAFVVEQLDGVGEITPKRMFGGVGIYANGIFFAILDNDRLFLKVDDSNRAEFVAAVQVIVYAGAVMVLFVFTIMLLNAGAEERTKGSRVALIFGVPGTLLGSLLLAWVVLRHSGTEEVMAGALPGAPKTIGPLLFHEFLLPFEITSILILIAIMGAVVLASKPPTTPVAPARGDV